jgi:hypothetical protein
LLTPSRRDYWVGFSKTPFSSIFNGFIFSHLGRRSLDEADPRIKNNQIYRILFNVPSCVPNSSARAKKVAQYLRRYRHRYSETRSNQSNRSTCRWSPCRRVSKHACLSSDATYRYIGYRYRRLPALAPVDLQ